MDEPTSALTAKGITEGTIGIVNVNAASTSCVAREEGFRSAFEGTVFELPENRYGEGDAAKFQAIAENCITQGAVGIFGCNESSTNAVKAAVAALNGENLGGVVTDTRVSVLAR